MLKTVKNILALRPGIINAEKFETSGEMGTVVDLAPFSPLLACEPFSIIIVFIELTTPSTLQIHRNYENAIKQIGGAVLYSDDEYSYMKLVKGDKEIWVELTAKRGIAAPRLKAGGVGPLAPVAANDSDAGKAKNRRVELVKQ